MYCLGPFLTMPSTRAPPKQPNDAVEDTQSNKRQRHEPDLLEGVDVSADRLSTKVGVIPPSTAPTLY